MELSFVGLLRAFWVATILPILIASMPSSRLSSFHGAVMVFCKRGKIMQSPSRKFTVPQKFFCHFYLFAVVWTTILLLPTWIYAYRMVPVEQEYRVWSYVFLLLLMEIQVCRRAFESFYVFKYSPSARLHILGYLTGIFYYMAAPLSLCCNCLPEVFRFTVNQMTEFIVEGKSQMPASGVDWWEAVNPLMKLGLLHWIGAAIFFWGWIHQRRCHVILGSLRSRPGEIDKYVIPRGDWFEIVSSPHYLAEIVIYVGLLIASGGDLTVWLLFGFVVANLAFAAAETHRWYHSKFDNYPRNRRAIIPFVY
ncbi:hypothetical protein SLE2022_042980 [Rubroshorea leprosula]